jgi:hypothetical protein
MLSPRGEGCHCGANPLPVAAGQGGGSRASLSRMERGRGGGPASPQKARRAPPERAGPLPARAFARVGPLPFGRGGARNPPGGPGRRRCDVKEQSGGAGRQGRLTIFRTPGHPASRTAISVPRPSALPASLGVLRSDLPARAFGAVQVGPTGLSRVPHLAPRRSGPAVVRGGRISDGLLAFARNRNRPWPPEPGARVGSGRRRRSRPTLTTPRESVPRRTGCEFYRTKFRSCQGFFSGSRRGALNGRVSDLDPVRVDDPRQSITIREKIY